MITPLIREITFRLRQYMWSQSTNVTERQTDGRTIRRLSHGNTAPRTYTTVE